MSEDRGVGSVIGAVIVLTILFTSVSSYLLFVERGDQRVNDSQKIRLERLRERSIEDLEISLINNDGLKANVTNLGPLTTTIVYYILISIEDNSIIKNNTINITLKDGYSNVIDLEFAPDNYDYMIKLVTERGSVFTDICYDGCYETTELNYSNNGSSDSITLGPMDVSLNLEYAVFTSSNDIEFDEPRGVAVDSNDRIIVADTKNDRIQVFDSNGNFLFNNFNSNSSLTWLTKDTIPVNESIVFRLNVTNIADNAIWLTPKTSITLFEVADSNRVISWHLVKDVSSSIDYLFDDVKPYIKLPPNTKIILYFAASKPDKIDKDPPTMPTPAGRVWGVTLFFIGYFGEEAPNFDEHYTQNIPYTVIIAE